MKPLYLLDIKTSDKVWPEYYIQLAAYKSLVKLNLDLDVTPGIILITKSGKLSLHYPDFGLTTRSTLVWDNLIKVYHDLTAMKKMS